MFGGNTRKRSLDGYDISNIRPTKRRKFNNNNNKNDDKKQKLSESMQCVSNYKKEKECDGDDYYDYDEDIDILRNNKKQQKQKQNDYDDSTFDKDIDISFNNLSQSMITKRAQNDIGSFLTNVHSSKIVQTMNETNNDYSITIKTKEEKEEYYQDMIPRQFYVDRLKLLNANELYKEAILFKNNNHSYIDICCDCNTKQCILNGINNGIIDILKRIINTNGEEKGLEIDVAFAHILVLIDYTNYEIEQIVSNTNQNESHFLSYLVFLVYFIIITNFENKYDHLIVIDENDKNIKENEALNYLLNEFRSKFKDKDIKYRYYNKFNIICSFLESDYFLPQDISLQIAKTTDLQCLEFLHFVNKFIGRRHEKLFSKCTSNQEWLGQSSKFTQIYNPSSSIAGLEYLLSEIFLGGKFINVQKDNFLKHKCGELSFKFFDAYQEERDQYYHLAKFLAHYSYIKCYLNPIKFIQLFETTMPKRDISKFIKITMTRFSQSDIVPIFYRGNFDEMEEYGYLDMIDDGEENDDFYQMLHANIDDIFKLIINRYCVQNTHLMIHLFYQILVSTQYLLSKAMDCSPSKQRNKLIDKQIECIYKYFLLNAQYLTEYNQNLWNQMVNDYNLLFKNIEIDVSDE